MSSSLVLSGQTSIDDLYRVCSIYGNVERIKKLYAKPDNALVMFCDPRYACVRRARARATFRAS